jgi:hypothetical protein
MRFLTLSVFFGRKLRNLHSARISRRTKSLTQREFVRLAAPTPVRVAKAIYQFGFGLVSSAVANGIGIEPQRGT